MESLSSLKARIDFVRNFKENFDGLKPLEKCVFVRSIGLFFLEKIGVDILNPNYENHLLSALPGIALGSYYVFLVYTTYVYRDDFMRVLLPYCVLGVVVPVSLEILQSVRAKRCFDCL